MIFIFTILCTFSYTSGVDYVLVTIEDITLLKDFQSMLKTTNSIIVLSSSCLISWFIILFYPPSGINLNIVRTIADVVRATPNNIKAKT